MSSTNPIGSTTMPDLFLNAGNLDRAMNSDLDNWTDRFGVQRITFSYMERVTKNGQGLILSREALKRTYAEAGLNLVEGSFEEGGTLNFPNDVLLQQNTGLVFEWTGTFPKPVPKDSQPTAGWVRSVKLQKTILASGIGCTLLGFSVEDGVVRSLYDKLTEKKSVKDFGAVGDGITDDTIALEKAGMSGQVIYFPKGVYRHSRGIPLSSNTYFIAEPNELVVLKMMDGVDQVHHSIVSANAVSLDARLATLATVDQLVGGYVDNVGIVGIRVDGNNKNRPKTYNDREQGTGIELHAVTNALIKSVRVHDALQHCINVRAGTGSYNLGYDYKEKYPSKFIRIVDCFTDNQLYDDGITTHDSEYIWITRCETWMTRNSTFPLGAAISNGIEVDDGSRYVWVTECYSNGGFGGYQVKGHTNTVPAHHVWFENCIAENNHMAFIIAAVDSPNTNPQSNEATCNHIYLNKCVIKNTYVFSNVSSWTAEAHYIQFYNARHIYINDLQVIGKTHDMNNMGAIQKVIFRSRATNGHIYVNGIELQNVDERSILEAPLFSFESNFENFNLINLNLDKFTKGNVLFTNATGVNWVIKNPIVLEGSPNYAVFSIKGVGGGTLVAEKVKGSGFVAGYDLGGTKCSAILLNNYERRVSPTESAFHDVRAQVSTADSALVVNSEIGNQHTYVIDGTEHRIGRISTQVMSGNPSNTDCVTRIRLAGRDGVNGSTITFLNVLSNSLSPALDGTMSGGSPGRRFSQFFAVNDQISISDATRKTVPRDIDQKEIKAFSRIAKLPMVWRWLEKYQIEGEDARIHSGPTVQDCIKIMEEEDLHWEEYSCFCFDTYPETFDEYEILEPEIKTDEGTIIKPAVLELVQQGTPAGEVFSLRKGELMWWCLRAMFAKLETIEERLSKLEQ